MLSARIDDLALPVGDLALDLPGARGPARRRRADCNSFTRKYSKRSKAIRAARPTQAAYRGLWHFATATVIVSNTGCARSASAISIGVGNRGVRSACSTSTEAQ